MPQLSHLNYTEKGTGQVILFLHGWCMSSAIWGLQQDAVAAEHRFLALDLRGHGGSGLPEGGVRGFSGYADDILLLAEHLDLNNIVAVGWSLGAQALLKAYPRLHDRVAALVLVGATPRFSAAAHFPYGLLPKEAEGMRLKVRRNLGRALEGFHRNMFAADEFDTQESVRLAEEQLAKVVMPSAEAALVGLEALMEEELLDEARMVNCPTLLMHGDQDRVCLPQASEWLTQTIPGSRRYSFKGCGHAPFLSHPEQFNRELLCFVEALCA